MLLIVPHSFIVVLFITSPYSRISEFKKVRRLLQRKFHFQIELCDRLGVLRLFHIGHVERNGRSGL